MALSLAAGHTQGLSRQSGSMAHFYDMGLCARNGTVAALLAQGGFTGSPSIIEDSPGGLCYAFAGEGKYDLEEMMNSLGKPPLCIMSVGIKKYACCWEEHRIIDSLVELKDKYQISYKDLENIEVHVGPFFSRFVRYSKPANVEESRFSIEHSLASVFLENEVVYNLEIYGDEKKILSPTYAEARQKVSVVNHPEREFSAMGGADQIIVKLKNGKEFKRECETARGVPPAYLSEEDVRKKFRNCIEYSQFLTEEQVRFVEENVSGLERIKDATKLLDVVTYGKKKQKRVKM